MGGSHSIQMNDKGIFIQTGNEKLTLTKDGIMINGVKMDPLNNALNNVTSVTTMNHVTRVCKNNQCIQFDCDKAKMKNNKVYCHDVLYYQYIDQHFKDMRS